MQIQSQDAAFETMLFCQLSVSDKRRDSVEKKENI